MLMVTTHIQYMRQILDWRFKHSIFHTALLYGAVAFFFSLFFGCEKKPLIYRPEDVNTIIHNHDKHADFFHPTDPKKGVSCSRYSKGCLGVTLVHLKNMDMIVVVFQSVEQASAEAKRIGQWFAKNVVFDDVMGELMLQEFIEEVFEAEPGVVFVRPYYTPRARPPKSAEIETEEVGGPTEAKGEEGEGGESGEGAHAPAAPAEAEH